MSKDMSCLRGRRCLRYVELMTEDERGLHATALANCAMALIKSETESKLASNISGRDHDDAQLQDAWLCCVQVIEMAKLLNCVTRSVCMKAVSRRDTVENLLHGRLLDEANSVGTGVAHGSGVGHWEETAFREQIDQQTLETLLRFYEEHNPEHAMLPKCVEICEEFNGAVPGAVCAGAWRDVMFDNLEQKYGARPVDDGPIMVEDRRDEFGHVRAASTKAFEHFVRYCRAKSWGY